MELNQDCTRINLSSKKKSIINSYPENWKSLFFTGPFSWSSDRALVLTLVENILMTQKLKGFLQDWISVFCRALCQDCSGAFSMSVKRNGLLVNFMKALFINILDGAFKAVCSTSTCIEREAVGLLSAASMQSLHGLYLSLLQSLYSPVGLFFFFPTASCFHSVIITVINMVHVLFESVDTDVLMWTHMATNTSI